MIEATQRKLREAQFFLERLIQARGQAVRNEPEVLGYYLSALLSAARSVTWALQFEEKDKYDTWFPAWLASRGAEEQALLRFLKNQRNDEQKRGGAGVASAWDYIPISQVPRTDRSHPAYGDHWFGPPGTPEPRVGVLVHSFESAEGEPEVADTCRRYIGLLSELVRDFLHAHSHEAI